MNIRNIGYKATHRGDFFINRPRGSGDYVFLLFRTAALLTRNGNTVPVSPGTVLFYKIGTPQQYRGCEEKYIDDYIHVELSDEEAARICALGISFDTPVACGDTTLFSEIIQQMHREKYSVNPCKTETLQLYFHLLTVKLGERLNHPDLYINYPHYESLATLRSEIYRKPSEDWSVKKTAQKLLLSESYVQHLYKRIFGVGVMTDVIHSRIEQAKDLLTATERSVAQIAEDCGYQNDVHFIRQFKRIVGTTPYQYRKTAFAREK